MTTREEYLMRRVDILYREALAELHGIGIEPSDDIEEVCINKRAKKRLGCCKKRNSHGAPSFSIEISLLCEGIDDKTLKEIIIHELLHTCPGCLNHGKKWKNLAEKVKKLLGYEITTTARFRELGLEEDSPEPRYALKCRNCGHIMYRSRRSKAVRRPHLYRCGGCGGRLDSFTLT